MPFIEAKLSIKLDEKQKDSLQAKLSDAAAGTFSKPKAFVMAEIEDNKTLYMNDKRLEKGAYISIKLVGTPTKPACQALTKNICDILAKEYGIDGSNIYITYHPVDLWGWNGSMF